MRNGTMQRGTTNRNDRGSAANRRARKAWLVETWGDGFTVVCAFEGCAAVLTEATVTVDRWPVPGCQGGTYARDNIRPACDRCNYIKGGAVRRTSL